MEQKEQTQSSDDDSTSDKQLSPSASRNEQPSHPYQTRARSGIPPKKTEKLQLQGPQPAKAHSARNRRRHTQSQAAAKSRRKKLQQQANLSTDTDSTQKESSVDGELNDDVPGINRTANGAIDFSPNGSSPMLDTRPQLDLTLTGLRNDSDEAAVLRENEELDEQHERIMATQAEINQQLQEYNEDPVSEVPDNFSVRSASTAMLSEGAAGRSPVLNGARALLANGTEREIARPPVSNQTSSQTERDDTAASAQAQANAESSRTVLISTPTDPGQESGAACGATQTNGVPTWEQTESDRAAQERKLELLLDVGDSTTSAKRSNTQPEEQQHRSEGRTEGRKLELIPLTADNVPVELTEAVRPRIMPSSGPVNTDSISRFQAFCLENDVFIDRRGRPMQLVIDHLDTRQREWTAESSERQRQAVAVNRREYAEAAQKGLDSMNRVQERYDEVTAKYSDQIQSLLQDKNALQVQVQETNKDVAQKQAQFEGDKEQDRGKIAELTRENATLRGMLAESERERDGQLSSTLAPYKKALSNVKADRDKQTAQVKQLELELERMKKGYDSVMNQVSAFQHEWDNMSTQTSVRDALKDSAVARNRVLNEEIVNNQGQLLGLLEATRRQRTKLQGMQKDKEDWVKRKEALKRQLAAQVTKTGDVEEELAAARLKAENLESRCIDLERTALRAVTSTDGNSLEMNAALDRIKSLTTERDALNERHKRDQQQLIWINNQGGTAAIEASLKRLTDDLHQWQQMYEKAKTDNEALCASVTELMTQVAQERAKALSLLQPMQAATAGLPNYQARSASVAGSFAASASAFPLSTSLVREEIQKQNLNNVPHVPHLSRPAPPAYAEGGAPEFVYSVEELFRMESTVLTRMRGEAHVTMEKTHPPKNLIFGNSELGSNPWAWVKRLVKHIGFFPQKSQSKNQTNAAVVLEIRQTLPQYLEGFAAQTYESWLLKNNERPIDLYEFAQLLAQATIPAFSRFQPLKDLVQESQETVLQFTERLLTQANLNYTDPADVDKMQLEMARTLADNCLPAYRDQLQLHFSSELKEPGKGETSEAFLKKIGKTLQFLERRDGNRNPAARSILHKAIDKKVGLVSGVKEVDGEDKEAKVNWQGASGEGRGSGNRGVWRGGGARVGSNRSYRNNQSNARSRKYPNVIGAADGTNIAFACNNCFQSCHNHLTYCPLPERSELCFKCGWKLEAVQHTAKDCEEEPAKYDNGMVWKPITREMIWWDADRQKAKQSRPEAKGGDEVYNQNQTVPFAEQQQPQSPPIQCSWASQYPQQPMVPYYQQPVLPYYPQPMMQYPQPSAEQQQPLESDQLDQLAVRRAAIIN